MLVDSRLVGEGVGADDRLVALHHEPRHLGEESARGVDLPGVDSRLEPVEVGAGPEGHHHFLERTVPRALADAVDGALDLAGSGAESREAIGDREAEIVVAVDAYDRAIDVPHVLPEVSDSLCELVRGRVADGIGDVDGRGPGVDHPLHHLREKIELGAGGVLGRELDVITELARYLHPLDRAPDDLLFRHLQLVLAVDRARRQENVDPGALSFLQRFPRALDVHPGSARETRDHRSLDLPGHFAHRLEITVRGDGKARFENIHSEERERSRHRELSVEVHAAARRLLAVSQRRIENHHSIRGFHQGSPSSRAASGKPGG